MKIATLSLLLLGSSIAVKAQSYWQQRVDTKLEVTLDDKKHFLHGSEEFTYTNNSPDTLRYLYLHLWPNAYKNDRTAFCEQQLGNGTTDFYYSKAEDRGYIDSLSFTIDGKDVSYYSTDNAPDIARIDLRQPLLPGAKLVVATPFRVKIPKVFSRLGHTGQAYYISQWFPKPAVYDRKGWHPIPYLDQGEFYSEIGSYDATIILPENYVVMGTGNCLDEKENEWLDDLSKKHADTGIKRKILTKAQQDSLNKFPKSSTAMKTLHFHEDNVHDFAWFADKRFLVKKDTVQVPGSDHVTTIWTAALPSSKYSWSKSTDDVKLAIQQYSKWVGPYPYKTVKAVEGDMKAGGGMEYPTVTIIQRGMGGSSLQQVIVHEVGHNWFQGILASNERDHPWMDEGINSFYEQKTTAYADTSKKNKTSVTEGIEKIAVYEFGNTGVDQPINLPSTQYQELNYGVDVYFKTPLYLHWLEGYMGEEDFEKAMHAYFGEWKHKHPQPEDFETTFRKNTSKNLDWFFNDAMQSQRRVDFAVKKVQQKDGSLNVTVKNRSAFPAPVKIGIYNKDSLQNSVWSEPFTGTTSVTLPATDDWKRVIVSFDVPDIKAANNSFSRNGLAKHGGIGISKFGGFNRSLKERTWLAPSIGYNTYDGFMLGLLYQNAFTIPENHFRFAVAPMYAFGSSTFAGAGSVGYFWNPKGIFKELAFQTDAKTFHYDRANAHKVDESNARYTKVAPGFNFTFRERDARSTVTRTLLLKSYFINEESILYTQDPVDSIYKPTGKSNEWNSYGVLRYQHRNDRVINPFYYGLEAQVGSSFVKLNLEGKLRIDYNTKNKGLYIRAFAGKFISFNGTSPIANDRYLLNSTFTGVNDYLYDDTYLGRSERDGLASHQISIREGGMKLATPYYANPLGRSDNWLASINLSTDLPLKKLPIRLYLDAATFADAKNLNPSGNRFLYSGGIEIHTPFYDILSIYIPIVMSRDYNDYYKSIFPNDKFGRSISFQLQLQNINWLKAPQRAIRMIR